MKRPNEFMRKPSTDAISIAPRQPLVLPARDGQTIFCDSGTVWVTQGDGEDYVLTAGEKLILAPADKVIVSAMAKVARIRYGSQRSPGRVASLIGCSARKSDGIVSVRARTTT